MICQKSPPISEDINVKNDDQDLIESDHKMKEKSDEMKLYNN